MKVFRILLALVALTSSAAFADSVTFDLNVSNGFINPSAPSYGLVTLDLNSNNTITFTVTMASGYGIAGGGPAFGFNLGSGVGTITISSLTPGFSPNGSGNLDGFGSFAVEINGPAPGQSNPSVLSFTVSQAGGFTSVYQLVGLNPKGWDFAAHVVPIGSNISTGYAATTTTKVPEGGGLTLLLSGLVCFGSALLFRPQRKSLG